MSLFCTFNGGDKIVLYVCCPPSQGKRVTGEDGSEGFSDLFQENSMLQRENDTLRMRVKAMQETIDHLNTRVTTLLANEVSTLLAKSGKIERGDAHTLQWDWLIVEDCDCLKTLISYSILFLSFLV